MHEIEPHFAWLKYYNSTSDPCTPFYNKVHSEISFTDTIYGYYIHPQWDFFGTETLYVKIIFADYEWGGAILEFIGEWNDAINNDIMHLKRNVIETLGMNGINKFILIGENVFNFHGSDDCYYEEWYEDTEDGWITAMNFQPHVVEEMGKYHLDYYINFGGELDQDNWRTKHPLRLLKEIHKIISYRLN